MTAALKIRNVYLLAFLFFIFSIVYLVFVPLSFAQTNSATPNTRSREAGSGFARQKLDAKKLKVCQTKEKVIKNRLDSLTRLVINMEEKFGRIAQRVKNFYANKVLPKGKTLANYDALVADIDAKKAAADAALNAAKTNADSFACGADNPKGALSGFRKDMQNVKSALKEYRTSIKNLIVAVKASEPVTE